ncbi:LysR family transcriptional regulator [Gordonia paraffinivorans]|uniref:LysR family transcriptional regulator n=1 Tax=Gordonia paraffinivorans TaxID=175628 RepID=UPI000D61633D|nr:LysR family transcriptional regulator [Gordonia paraffinivorans]PWD41404.1 LysR family transcriptional regulator [Gordonia paraffinivorans]
MVDVHRLRVLRSVIGERSIGGAAAALGYTPSAVSQHITALQRETGLTLVERDGRGIVPTEAGVILATESEAVFEQLARVDGLISELRDGRLGQLRINYFASAGAVWIPPIVATISREFPGLRMDLRLIELLDPAAPSPDVEIYVEADERRATDAPGFVGRPLTDDPYLAVVPQDSEWADRESVTLHELSRVPWVDNDVARGPCRKALLNACTAVGFSPDFSVETQDYPTAIRFVAAGIGLTVVPELALADLPDGVVAVPIVDPTPSRAIRVRVRRSAVDLPPVRRVLELLDTTVAQQKSSPAGRGNATCGR